MGFEEINSKGHRFFYVGSEISCFKGFGVIVLETLRRSPWGVTRKHGIQ